MKRILILSALALSLALPNVSCAQCFGGRCTIPRYSTRASYGARSTGSCYSGACYSGACYSGACYSGSCYSTGYARAATSGYWTSGQCYGVVAPCERVETVPPCESVQPTQEPIDAPTCAPCGAVQKTDALSPGEYVPQPAKSACPTGACPIAAPIKQKVAKAVASLLSRANATRARYGLPALQYDQTLEVGAESQAVYCSQIGTLRHGSGVAEILAMNHSGFDQALSQWVASPGHRALLLGGYSRAGAAVHVDAYGRVWCAMRFR